MTGTKSRFKALAILIHHSTRAKAQLAWESWFVTLASFLYFCSLILNFRLIDTKYRLNTID